MCRIENCARLNKKQSDRNTKNNRGKGPGVNKFTATAQFIASSRYRAKMNKQKPD